MTFHRAAACAWLAALGSLAPCARALAGDVPTSAPAPGAKPEKPVADPDAEALAFAASVEDALVKAVASVHESSVTVFNLASLKDEPPHVMSGGSGVIVAWNGKGPFVLTNEHVIKGNKVLQVRTCDGQTHEVVKKYDAPQYDFALLEFK